MKVFVIQNFVVFTFILSVFIATFRWQPLCYKQFPAFSQNFQKKVSLFVQVHTKNTSYVLQTTASRIKNQDDKTCFLHACKNDSILHGNFEELLKKLDTFCFTYKQGDCLYTLFKYRFGRKVIVKSGQVFYIVQRAVDFNHRNKGVDRMPSIAIKKLLRKKFKNAFIQPLSKDKNDAD